MLKRQGIDIVYRWEGNPIITIEDLSFKCSDICNAGAVKVDGEYMLLVTIQNLEGRYSIYPAKSTDGYHFEVEDEPIMSPAKEEPYKMYEELGVLDARVVPLEGVYYISYDAFGHHGYRLGLARTEDFKTIQRVGLMSEPDTKGGVLFPRRIRGKYARLERPWEGGSIWVTYSDDLEYWGSSEVVMTPRPGFWDSNRIGVATPPIETDQGWLFMYYGVRQTSAGPLFRIGAAILDLEDPSKVLGRTNVPILSPREEYERIGDVPNIVFSCGAIVEPDGEVKLYYGAANSCICMGTTKVQDIITACKESDKEF
ncbi:MAG: glycosidase [Candidatus Latescibacterota bacterium]|nr:MAG: glycosidase [Candidatus Latescibacterota bacterium]